MKCILFILLLATCCYAQTAPFAKYNFDDGGYAFLGIFSHHDDHPLQEQLGEFFTDDIATLKQLKRSWVFTRTQKDYACGYHYQFLLLKSGVVQDSFVVNLECNQLRTKDESLYFDLKKLKSFSSKFKKLRPESKEFSTVQEARSYLEKIKTDPNFMFVDPPRWSDFEGKFQFRVSCPTPGKSCWDDFDRMKPTLEKDISATYPNEPFKIRQNGGSSGGELFIEIQCNKSLAEKFDLYDRWNRESFGRWEAYHPYLVAYFKPAN
ncbi:MAG TPA: hypothetical protein VJV05_15420 [Pyrinomonadaceae bacterium]|nr:hypothetical protein [Pyrinomonadaceae bacterium]